MMFSHCGNKHEVYGFLWLQIGYHKIIQNQHHPLLHGHLKGMLTPKVAVRNQFH